MVNSPHTQIQTHTHTHTWTLTLPKMISSRCCTRAYLKWPNFVPAVFSLSSGMCLPVADCLPIKAPVPPRPQHSVIKTQDMDSDHGVLPLPVATWFLPVNFLIYAHIPVCLAACHLYACQPLFPRQSLLVLTVDRRRWGIWLTELKLAGNAEVLLQTKREENPLLAHSDTKRSARKLGEFLENTISSLKCTALAFSKH